MLSMGHLPDIYKQDPGLVTSIEKRNFLSGGKCEVHYIIYNSEKLSVFRSSPWRINSPYTD